jgi:hypothetical protein
VPALRLPRSLCSHWTHPSRLRQAYLCVHETGASPMFD